MALREIAKNIERIRREIAVNCYGEKVTLVAATKTRTVEEIKEAIDGGVDAIAENRAQEFRDKNDLIPSFPRHFIGRLQSNKLKYIVGKVDLIHSCDSENLAKEISLLSVRRGVESEILLEVNIGLEESKGGFTYEEAFGVYEKVSAYEALKIRGFMAMLPAGIDEENGGAMVRKMRMLSERAREKDPSADILSMGMSEDYLLCVKNGSNAVRIGTGIFGKRR